MGALLFLLFLTPSNVGLIGLFPFPTVLPLRSRFVFKAGKAAGGLGAADTLRLLSPTSLLVAPSLSRLLSRLLFADFARCRRELEGAGLSEERVLVRVLVRVGQRELE
jgi:hypothetical protein